MAAMFNKFRNFIKSKHVGPQSLIKEKHLQKNLRKKHLQTSTNLQTVNCIEQFFQKFTGMYNQCLPRTGIKSSSIQASHYP